MQNFLPKNYEAPKSVSGYMKLEEGENRIRILSSPILGWEDWTKERKPIRFRFDDKPEAPIDKSKPIKHFWAFIVWNYKEQLIQILEITQASIRKRIQALCDDADWGAPFSYDIKISKTGEGVDTEYSLNPSPVKPIDSAIVKAFRDKPIYLEALFDNGDPFAPNERGEVTPGCFEAPSVTKTLQAKVEAAVASDPDDLDTSLESFMDFMPAHVTRERVEEFAKLCAKASKQSVEDYIGDQFDNIDHFVSVFERWNEKAHGSSKKATA